MAHEYVLVEIETGDEYVFGDASEYWSAKYSGGYRDKEDTPASSAQPLSPTATTRQPAPQPVDRPVRPDTPQP